MKKDVKVTVTGSVDHHEARIDGKLLTFDSGKAAEAVEAGPHFLQYFAIGAPGNPFTISITAPPEAKWSRAFIVPADGIVLGSKKFTVKDD